MYEMSYFNAPIAPVKDADGRVIRKATLVPHATVSVEQVFNLITENAELQRVTQLVRTAADFRVAKTMMLPYVTPCGVFSYRKSSSLVSLSGLMPLDIDHLSSREEAERLRDKLFNDPYLMPVLAFVSPSGRGVKAFISIDNGQLTIDNGNSSMNNCQLKLAMDYVRMVYGDCDASGKDIARSCFLCHDGEARLRKLKILSPLCYESEQVRAKS